MKTAFSATVAETIIDRQAVLNVSDDQVAAALGHSNWNALRMIKKGEMKLPIDSVEAMAKVLELDAVGLLRLTLLRQTPGLLEVLDRLMPQFTLTPAEQRIIEYVRAVARGEMTLTISTNAAHHGGTTTQ